MAEGHAFLGTGWAFPPEFHRPGKAVRMVTEEEDIHQALGILLATTPGERIMQPSFGCGLKSMLFERIGEATVTEIRDLVARAVLFFEPRIDLEHVEVVFEDAREGRIEIGLTYRIRTTNTRSNRVYPFYLRQGTDLTERR